MVKKYVKRLCILCLYIPIVVSYQINSVLANASYLSLDPVPNQINAVRFDPSYYYD